MAQLFKDPNFVPTKENLQITLNEGLKSVYSSLLEILTAENVMHEWRYYNDGKSWLLKSTFKKKTVFWLSLWEEFIKVSFYFTEKTKPYVIDLEINELIKLEFVEAKPIGKLIPLTIDIKDKNDLVDFQKILTLKKTLK